MEREGEGEECGRDRVQSFQDEERVSLLPHLLTMCPSGPSCLTYTGSHRPCSQNPTQSIQKSQPHGCVRVSDDFTFASVAALIINHGNSLHSKLEAGPSQLGLILFHRGVTQVPDRPTPRECHLVCSRPYASIQSCFATSHPLPIFLPPATVSYPPCNPSPKRIWSFPFAPGLPIYPSSTHNAPCEFSCDSLSFPLHGRDLICVER